MVANYRGVFYAIIVSYNPDDPEPLWTFVSLYSNASAAMQAIERQYYLESTYAKKASRFGSCTGVHLIVESTEGRKVEFRMVTLTSSEYIPDVTPKLYAVAVNGHILVAGGSFYATKQSLKRYDVVWDEALELLHKHKARLDNDQEGIYTCLESEARHYRIVEFTVKKEIEENP